MITFRSTMSLICIFALCIIHEQVPAGTECAAISLLLHSILCVHGIPYTDTQ